MKVKFEFDTMSENFEPSELESHYQADKMVLCISKIIDQLRSWYKYDAREEIPVDEIREKILDIIDENVNMERLGY